MLLVLVDCKKGDSPACKSYVDAVCQLCGKEGSTCTGMTAKYTQCVAKKECKSEICRQSLKGLLLNTAQDNRKLLCAPR